MKSTEPVIGLVEWFAPGEFARVEQVLANLRTLSVNELRTGISWAGWYNSEGDGWYDWLFPRLAREVKILPCFLYTPPSLGSVPKFSSPPQTPKAYADFIDVMITRYGNFFEWIELWNRPNDHNEWDVRLDPGWKIFTEMIGGAAFWARQRKKKTVLPGMWPRDAGWLELIHDRGVLPYIDAVGLHGFPGSTEFPWKGWWSEAAAVRESLMKLGSEAEVWITATGSSTWRENELGQVRAFVDAVEAPVDRVYWRETQDRKPSTIDSFHSDEREYHYGLTRSDGSAKLLFNLWSKSGVRGVRDSVSLRNSLQKTSKSKGHVLITGGAGFIGTNLAHRLLSSGRRVMLYDNFSRPGVERNADWLRERHGDLLQVENADIRDRQSLHAPIRHAESVFHFAAQVAVTSSLIDPQYDFEVNVGGTLNVLEEIRALDTPIPLLFTSTNKVYGGLADLDMQKNCTRYMPVDQALRSGISEMRPLDFHSPYGCSKGAADQYVLDYARSFGLPAVVFRMSCIYGFHQMGTEDQGWVAHFLIRALRGEPIVLYGDGMQVRDILFIDDLVDAFLLAEGNIHSVSGQAFNVGGGLGNTISLLELLESIKSLQGELPQVQYKDWRCGDQRYYVSDTSKLKSATGWSPKVSAHEGVKKLFQWLQQEASPEIPGLVSATGGYAVHPY